MDFYVLKYPNGDYVALDEMSGGYPYRTSNLNQVHFWSTAEEADRYRNVGGNQNGFTIHKVVELVTKKVTERVTQVTQLVDPM